MAYRRLEPDPIDRLRMIITTGLGALCNAWGVPMTPEDLDPVLKDEVQEVTPDQAEAIMRTRYGG